MAIQPQQGLPCSVPYLLAQPPTLEPHLSNDMEFSQFDVFYPNLPWECIFTAGDF